MVTVREITVVAPEGATLYFSIERRRFIKPKKVYIRKCGFRKESALLHYYLPEGRYIKLMLQKKDDYVLLRACMTIIPYSEEGYPYDKKCVEWKLGWDFIISPHNDFRNEILRDIVDNRPNYYRLLSLGMFSKIYSNEDVEDLLQLVWGR